MVLGIENYLYKFIEDHGLLGAHLVFGLVVLPILAGLFWQVRYRNLVLYTNILTSTFRLQPELPRFGTRSSKSF